MHVQRQRCACVHRRKMLLTNAPWWSEDKYRRATGAINHRTGMLVDRHGQPWMRTLDAAAVCALFAIGAHASTLYRTCAAFPTCSAPLYASEKIIVSLYAGDTAGCSRFMTSDHRPSDRTASRSFKESSEIAGSARRKPAASYQRPCAA